MKYNGFLINGLLLILLAAVTITMQWQDKTIYDGMAKPALAMNLPQSHILAAPSASELH